MTVTETRDVRDMSRDTGRAVVRQIIEAGGKPRAAELPADHGMSERWWRDRINEAKAEVGTPALHAVPFNGTAGPARSKMNGTPRPAADPKPVARPARKPAARQRPPLPVMAAQIAAVALVAGVAVYVSYSHIRHLALYAGTPNGMAYVLPLGIDGMVVAATVSLLEGRRHGRRQYVAWAGIVLGGTASVAMNVLAVAPELVPLRAVQITLAAYSPLALALTMHLTAPMIAWMWKDR